MNKMLASYERQQLIGCGTFGHVYLIRSKTNGQKYVLKEVKLTNMSSSEKDQALTEVAILARCYHRNIIRYKEAVIDETSGILSIVMEYAEYGDMYAAIRRQNGVYFLEDDVLSWFIQITMALQHIHNQNILHRDLKTQNIFLTGNKTIKIGDFGIARMLKDQELATTAIGTPYYLSPEICQRKPYNYKSDIWALGCVLFEMAALMHPFHAPNLHELMKIILKAEYKELPKHCSVLIHDLVKLLLRVNPDERPSTAEILSIPKLSSHLHKHIDSYNTAEALSAIDVLSIASHKKILDNRRFSSDDVLELPRRISGVKRTISNSSDLKNYKKVQRNSMVTNKGSVKSTSSLSNLQSKKSNYNAPVPVASTKTGPASKRKSSDPTSVSTQKNKMGKTYSLWRKAVEKMGIGNKMLKESNRKLGVESDIDIGYQSGETQGRTDIQKHWSLPPLDPHYYEVSDVDNMMATSDDDVFDASFNKYTNSDVFHCPHKSQCQCCILDTLWRNRIKSTGDVDDAEKNRLRRTLETVLGKSRFQSIYSVLSKEWNHNFPNHENSLHLIVKNLNCEQRQYVPLLVQLLQLDFIQKLPL